MAAQNGFTSVSIEVTGPMDGYTGNGGVRTMKDTALIVGELRRRAAEGMTAVEIPSWLRDELGPEATFFMFASCLFRAFEIPVREIRTLEAWCGLGPMDGFRTKS